MSLAESDRLLVEHVRSGQRRRLARADRPLRGPAAGICRSPHWRPRGQRGRGSRDLPGLSHQPAELRPVAAAGKLSVFDRRAQADRPPAPRGRRPAIAACRPARRPARGSRPTGCAGQQPAAQRRAAQAGRSTPWSPRCATRSTGSASAGIGTSWPAWRPCSSAVGATRKPPPGSSSASSRWRISNSSFSSGCGRWCASSNPTPTSFQSCKSPHDRSPSPMPS